ncbi:Lysophospholipase L1 [Paenibacillus sp. yr247]|uniref:SGNH/GDSL hydrolase family protein n=1 Tax=Paenibacillus sp. yr247 TaxID=1761880 RepID=UPI00089261DB|nr:SGNH/GDSL hydrolase family protein [Paenibacillus sp. yr247]SDP28189.1 Lysophospholipase L1 [Paenibacillus sp. yr247]
MMKKVATTIAIAIMAGTLFSSSAWAKSDQARNQLVALGDSITYGYNLGVDNETPSEFAFPYLMKQDAKLKVNDLAIPGITSIQLLDVVQQDKLIRQDVKHADYITLDIGNNDLLQAVAAATNNGVLNIAALQQNLQNVVVPNLLYKLKNTILEIRSLTDAPIAVYNIYNPYQVTNQPMYTYSELLLTQLVNNNLASLIDSLKSSGIDNLALANAYLAFKDKQNLYVRPNDVHPTIEGQKILAEIGIEALGL